jgi:hypothetical protein
MIIRVERSGGFAGVTKCSEMDYNDLPASMKTMLTRLISGDSESFTPLKSVPRGAADHYSYKITIDDGTTQRVIACNQYNIPNNLDSLVKCVEKGSQRR